MQRLPVVLVLVAGSCVGDLSLDSRCQGLRFDALHRGAAGDGRSDDTTVLRAALDAAADAVVDAQSPAPCVVLQGGVFLSGGLELRPGVTLFIDSSAILRASTNGSAWLPRAVPNLVSGAGAHGAALVGEGVLDAQCPEYVTGSGHPSTARDGSSYWTDQLTFSMLHVPGHGGQRVGVLSVSDSIGIRVEGVTLADSHAWTSAFSNCTNLLVSDVKIYGDWRMPNNDGIDPCSCTNATLQNLDINVGDDAVSPKTNVKDGIGYLPMRGLTVQYSRLRSRSFAVKFGTETHGDMSGIVIDHVHIYSSHQGIGIDWRGAGNLHGAVFSNINVHRAQWDGSGGYDDPHWMGNAQPIFISNDVWSNNPGSGTGKVSNLRFENITSVSENGVMISGRGGLVEGIELVNVRLIIQQRPKNNASNGPHPSHNYHPTNPDSTTTPPHWDPEGDMPDKDAPVDGFFVEHASQVTFEGCSVSFLGQAEPGNSFGGCVRLGNGTHGVQPVQLTTCRLPAR